MVGETINNDLKQMITTLGGSPEALEDNLLSTKLNKIIELLDDGGGSSTDSIRVGRLQYGGTGYSTKTLNFDFPPHAIEIICYVGSGIYFAPLQTVDTGKLFTIMPSNMNAFDTNFTLSEDRLSMTLNAYTETAAFNVSGCPYFVTYF